MKIDNLNYKRIIKISILVIVSILILKLFIANINNSMNVDKLSVSIIDLDKSELSKELYSSLDNKMKIVSNENINDSISELAKGKIELILIIKEGYEEEIKDASMKELLIVYTGYNPAYSKLLLEIISEESLKTWVSYKLIRENEKIFNLDFESLKTLEVKNLVEIKESIVNENNSINEANKNIGIEHNLYIVLMLLISYCIVTIEGRITLKDKLSNTLKRMRLFSQTGRKKYSLNIIYEIIEIGIINTIIFSIFFFIRGISIKEIVLIILLQTIYLIIVKIINLIIIYVSKSIVAYNLTSLVMFLVNILLILLTIVKFDL